ncbi:DUF4407 domain-containing protein [Actinokineospora bangkokensis]|uniref:DUF4407 domain-containing protein n=1 Tax=Actinokineospora bangkokensis TaxID=1193682 RepID=A0A1Q9LHG1_9PSEU|nr:DUF4407 domain-containing protein [Actinokineospora bangkokensis]OLR91455.1 hypothetical protein BJP25_01055 [Actinokineospora bangkokensis]
MRLRRTLAILAGARREILDKAPGDTTKHAVMGGVLLSTAGLAGVSAFFALSSTLGLTWWAALICAAVWFVIILNLDRMLVVTLNTVSGVKAVAVTLPRIAMAAVIGAVVATPLTLQIFHQEIDSELQTMHAEAITRNQAVLDEAYKQIGALQQREKELEDAIAGRAADPVSADPDVKAAQTAYDSAETAYVEAERRAQCELDGTCGTGRAGVGTAYQEARATADRAKQVRDDAKRKLDDATRAAAARSEKSAGAAAADAQTKIDGVRNDLAVAQENKRRAEQESHDAAQGSTGLLARLEALDRITAGHATAQTAQWALTLLFFLIEVLPVLSKLLTMFGNRTLYDKVLARHDDALDVADSKAVAGQSQLAQQQVDAQVRAGQDAIDELVKRQGEISANAIRVWAEVARLRADEQLHAWYQQHVGPLAAHHASTTQFGPGAGGPGAASAAAHAHPTPATATTMPIPHLLANGAHRVNGSGPQHHTT